MQFCRRMCFARSVIIVPKCNNNQMRVTFTINIQKEISLPVDYRELLAATVRRVISGSKSDYMRHLNRPDELAASDHGFDLYTFSDLRGKNKIVEGQVVFLAGPITWAFASPVDELVHDVSMKLSTQGFIHLQSVSLPITSVATAEQPSFPAGMSSVPTHMLCLSPLLASAVSAEGSRYFLTPADGLAFSNAMGQNLVLKYRALNGKEPGSTLFQCTFDAPLIARGGGIRQIAFGGHQHAAAFSPFAVSGSADLISLGYSAGFGERTSHGFGMAEIVTKKPIR